MKIIILYIALLLSMGCNGQTEIKKDTITANKIQMERPTITDASERLNLNDFKDNLVVKKEKDDDVEYETYSYRKTDSLGNRISLDGGPRILVYTVKPKNSYYFIGKTYYGKSKNIQAKGLYFQLSNSTIAVGKEYFYNEQGKLATTTDHDLGWDFSVEKVVQFALDKGFELPKPGERNQVQISKQENKEKRKYWMLSRETHGKSGKGGYETYKLDAKTGEVLFHSETDGRFYHDMKSSPPVKIIVPDKTLKPQRVVYKTYDGKDYTESEWKIFEQEQYKEHLRKTGRADLIKPIETPKTDSNKNSFIADEEDSKPKKRKGFWG